MLRATPVLPSTVLVSKKNNHITATSPEKSDEAAPPQRSSKLTGRYAGPSSSVRRGGVNNATLPGSQKVLLINDNDDEDDEEGEGDSDDNLDVTGKNDAQEKLNLPGVTGMENAGELSTQVMVTAQQSINGDVDDDADDRVVPIEAALRIHRNPLLNSSGMISRLKAMESTSSASLNAESSGLGLYFGDEDGDRLGSDPISKYSDAPFAVHSPFPSAITQPSLFYQKRSLFLLDLFDSEQFADFCVSLSRTSLRLHRIILAQSPFFKRVFDGTSSAHNIAMDVGGFNKAPADPSIGPERLSSYLLDPTPDSRINFLGIHFVIRDLYDLTGTYRNMISEGNVIAIFNAACFLEVEELVEFCCRTIVSFLKVDNLLSFLADLDAITPSGAEKEWTNWSSLLGHQYPKLLCRYVASLTTSLVSFIMRIFIRHYLTEFIRVDTHEREASEARRIVQQLPIKWIQAVLSSDMLCVKDEYERYELAKTIFGVRRVDLIQVSLQSRCIANAGGKSDAGSLKKSVAPTKNFFASLLDNVMMPMRKKRKDFESGDDEDLAVKESHMLAKTPSLGDMASLFGARKIKIPRFNRERLSSSGIPISASEVIIGLFKNDINYCHMNFAQLDLVKRDAIVPESVVLECFWTQAELANRNRPPTATPVTLQQSYFSISIAPAVRFPPFRFAVRFPNVYEWLCGAVSSVPSPRFLHSIPVMCAGVQYRLSITPVMLATSKELVEENPFQSFKALLQRHIPDAVVPKSPNGVTQTPKPVAVVAESLPISYVIYACLPHSQHGIVIPSSPTNLSTVSPRVTSCDFEGRGKIEEFIFDARTELVLTAAIYFN